MILTSLSVWFLVKILFLFALLIYLIFAAVVVRQVYLMTSTLRIGFEVETRIIAWVHLFLAVAVFVFAFLVL